MISLSIKTIIIIAQIQYHVILLTILQIANGSLVTNAHYVSSHFILKKLIHILLIQLLNYCFSTFSTSIGLYKCIHFMVI